MKLQAIKAFCRALGVRKPLVSGKKNLHINNMHTHTLNTHSHAHIHKLQRHAQNCARWEHKGWKITNDTKCTCNYHISNRLHYSNNNAVHLHSCRVNWNCGGFHTCCMHPLARCAVNMLFFYDFALSLSVHVLLLCRPTGWIHYFTTVPSTHCTPRTTRLFKNSNFYSHLVPSQLRCEIYTFISFSLPQMWDFQGFFSFCPLIFVKAYSYFDFKVGGWWRSFGCQREQRGADSYSHGFIWIQMIDSRFLRVRDWKKTCGEQ